MPEKRQQTKVKRIIFYNQKMAEEAVGAAEKILRAASDYYHAQGEEEFLTDKP